MREREAFSPRDSILNATRNREKLSLQSSFYTPPPRLTEAVVNRTIHIICMYVYKWSVDIILIVYDNI